MKKYHVAALTALCCSVSINALAQASHNSNAGASALPESGIEDIIVTATRRAERLQDVPVSVTAVTSKSLAAAGVEGLRELTSVVPGFQGGRNAGINQPTIRGIGSSNIGIGDESNVATYVDGVYHPFSITNSIDLVEVERVEVLRGPQGTVFGRNATGGLISVITPDPSFDFGGKIEGRFGRMRNDANEYEARTYLTGGLSDKVAMDFAGLYRKNEGYLTDLVRGGGLGDERKVDLRSKLLLKPSDKVKIMLVGNWTDYKSSANSVRTYESSTAAKNIPGVILPVGPWDVSLTAVPEFNYNQLDLSLHTEFDFDSVKLETTSSYIHNHDRMVTDSDASNIYLLNVGGDFSGRSLSQEVRLLSANDGPLTWILGAYAFQLKGEWQDIRIMTPASSTRLDPNLKTTSYATFAEGTYELAKSVFLTAGIRYTTEDREFTPHVNLNPLPFGTAKETFSKWTYRTALRYNFSPKANVYISYGTGFKSGVFNESSTSPTAVKPENINAFEIGLKANPLPWLQTNASVYHYNYKDMQVVARNLAGLYVTQNASTAKIYGGELEAIAAVTNDLKIRLGYAYTHGEYSDFPNAQTFTPKPAGGNLVQALDVSGNQMIRAPRHTISLGLDYGVDLGGGRMEVNGNVYHSSTVYYDFLNLASQKPYTTVSGEVSWSPDRAAWKVSLWGKNITNEVVYQTLRPGALGTDAIMERPREVGVGVSCKF